MIEDFCGSRAMVAGPSPTRGYRRRWGWARSTTMPSPRTSCWGNARGGRVGRAASRGSSVGHGPISALRPPQTRPPRDRPTPGRRRIQRLCQSRCTGVFPDAAQIVEWCGFFTKAGVDGGGVGGEVSLVVLWQQRTRVELRSEAFEAVEGVGERGAVPVSNTDNIIIRTMPWLSDRWG